MKYDKPATPLWQRKTIFSQVSIHSLLFVAEFACIHEGDRDYLRTLARAVGNAGANAVKFQIFETEEVVTPDHSDFDFLRGITFSAQEWNAIIRECSEMGLAVWVDVSGAFSLEVVRIAADRIAGVKIHSADLDNPVVFENPFIKQKNGEHAIFKKPW